MDKIDAKIVRALQEDGRLTNQDLAEKVGLSPLVGSTKGTAAGQ